MLQRLGSGSTCVALAVERDGKQGVLKIAKEACLNERVRSEAAVLADLQHPNIVRCYGPHEIDGLAAVFMEQAGDKTLGQRLRNEGRLSLDLLERFGDELLTVLAYLEREGINHRDIKPENIGIGKTRKSALTLKLFDFSLSKTPADNIRAGTPPYLDPFLSTRRPPRWDPSAERFSAAMTLYELATGTLPSWGEAGKDLVATEDEVTLDTELFDPSVRDPLTHFFAKELSRDYRRRHDNADEMHLAWRAVFQRIDLATTDDTDLRDEEFDLSRIEGLSRATRLSALGLSPRVLNASDRIGAATVGELLDLPAIRLYRNRGIGQRITRRLRHLREQLAEQLAVRPEALAAPEESAERLSIDRLAVSLVSIKLPDTELSRVRIWLGMEGNAAPLEDLRTVREAAEVAACSRAEAQAAIERAVEKWTKTRWMTVLRDELADFVRRREGIVTIDESSARLLGMRGSVAEGSLRRQRARAVVQSTIEVESTRPSARFILYRGPLHSLVIATEQLGGAFAAPPADRAAYVEALAGCVNGLARQDPLPSSRRVEEALAALLAPAGDQPISTERRLRLAVAVAPDAALSSRLELYPRALSAERALRLGSGALLGPKRLTVQQVQSRILSRFNHAELLPERPALDRLLEQAQIPLVWHEAEQGLPAGYAPPSRGTGLTTQHTSTLRRSTTSAEPVAVGPEAQTARQFEQTVSRAVSDGRVLIITCALPRLTFAGRELTRRFGLESVSLDALLTGAMREAARQAGADWRVVLSADRAARDSTEWRRLQALVARSLPMVRQHFHEASKPLLLEHIGLLVRYGQLGLIQSLRDEAQQAVRPARLILVPGDDQRHAPRLDGVALPVITPADWASMPRAWLENLHRGSATQEPSESAA